MIESRITDFYGQVVSKLIENDVKYNFAFYDLNNNLLLSETLVSISCRYSDCILPFIIKTTADDFGRFDSLTLYDYTLVFSNTTNTFSYSWNDQREETPVSTRLQVTRYLLNGSEVLTNGLCNSTSTSLLSTLTCSVGNQKARYTAQVFRTYDGDTARVTKLDAYVGDISSTFGVEGLLWVFILLFTCIGIGAFNPTVGAFLYLSGFIIMGTIGIISMSIPVFFANVVLTLLFMWAVNKNG